jgi:hypothetical protein
VAACARRLLLADGAGTLARLFRRPGLVARLGGEADTFLGLDTKLLDHVLDSRDPLVVVGS